MGVNIYHNGKMYTEYESASKQLQKLRDKLIETAQELGCMIDMENARLEQNITSTDLDDPDYFDHQTVHEAMKLAKAT